MWAIGISNFGSDKLRFPALRSQADVWQRPDSLVPSYLVRRRHGVEGAEGTLVQHVLDRASLGGDGQTVSDAVRGAGTGQSFRLL